MSAVLKPSDAATNQKQFKKRISITEGVQIHEGTATNPVESEEDSVQWTTRTEETERDIKRRRVAIKKAFGKAAQVYVDDSSAINTVSRRLVVVNRAAQAQDAAEHDEEDEQVDPDETINRDAPIAKARRKSTRISNRTEDEKDIVTPNPLLCKLIKPDPAKCACTSAASCRECIKYAEECCSSVVF